jgi:diketogulonate reductase-like aldo/keto reductase
MKKLNSGYDMPVFGLGVYQVPFHAGSFFFTDELPWLSQWLLSQVPPGESASTIVAEALKQGYRHVDTAAFYGNEVIPSMTLNLCSIHTFTDIFSRVPAL